MTVTIEIPEELAERYEDQALTGGLPFEQWLVKLAAQNLPVRSIVHLQKTNPEEWIRQVRAWAHSNRHLPILSDEAMSRDSIYPD